MAGVAVELVVKISSADYNTKKIAE